MQCDVVRPPGHWVRRLLTLVGIWLVALAATPRHATAQSCYTSAVDIGPCNVSFQVPPGTSNQKEVFSLASQENTPQNGTATVSCSGYVTSCSVKPSFITIPARGTVWDTVTFSVSSTGSTGQYVLTFNAASSTITVTPQTHYAPVVTLPYYNYDNVQPSLCSDNCFDKVLTYTTPAYYTLDTPRAVTLMYRSKTANPMVTVQVDALDNSATRPTMMSLQVHRSDGSAIMFTNHSPELFFTFSTQILPMRLAGQFSPVSLGRDTLTGAYNYSAIVTSYFADGTKLPTTIPLRVLLENERSSVFGAGWTVAGQQTIYPQSNGDVVITDGMGAISYFTLKNPPCTQGCSFQPPTGDFTTLTTKAQDQFGRHYDRRYPDGTTYEFLGSGPLAGIYDKLGLQTVFWYDSHGRDSLISDPHGPNFSFGMHFVYGDSANVSQGWKTGAIRIMYDPFGRYTWFGVGATTGDMNQLEDPYGNQYGGILLSVNASYNAQHQMTSNIDRHQVASHFGYDFAGKLAADSAPAVLADNATQPLVTTYQSPEATFLINPTSGVGTSTNPAPFEGGGPWWANVFDPEGHHTAFTVDRWGQPLTVNDPAGGTTLYNRGGGAYTIGGIPPIQIYYPWGGVDQFRYNSNGLLSWSLPAGGDSTTYLYRNSYGIPDSIFGPHQPTVSRSVGGGVIGSETIAHATTLYGYNNNFLIWIIDPLSHQTFYFYDNATGNLDSVAQSGNRFTKLSFDTYGRRYQTRSNLGGTRSTWYDPLNRVVKTSGGAQGDTTRFYYDSVYLTHVEDAKGQWWRSVVNALGWPTRIYDPADTVNLFESYTYDRDGNVASYTNRRNQTVNMTYDALNRVTAKSGTGVMSATYSYSANGRTVVGANAVSIDTIYLNTNGRVSSTATIFGPVAASFHASYFLDTQQRLDSEAVTASTGVVFPTRYLGWTDSTGTLSTIKVNGQTLTYNGYDPRFPRTSISYSPSIARFDYTLANGRVSGTSFAGSPSAYTFSPGYYYDAENRISQFQTYRPTEVTQAFAYDSLGRFAAETDYTGATCAASDSTFGGTCVTGGQVSSPITEQYDAVGNLVQSGTTTLVYGQGNRLQSYGATQYSEDADGNVIKRSDATHDMRYGWSPDGLLVSDTVHATGVAVQFDYDAFGHLVHRTTNGVSDRWYLWDQGQLLVELDGTATHRVEEYVYSSTDYPMIMLTGGTSVTATRYPVMDELGNVAGVFQPGTLSQEIIYSPFGQQTILSGTLGDTNRLRWRGLMWEGDSTQLYYMRNRWYDPVTGRFMSPDPLGLSAGINQYAFGGGDPINASDPSGSFFDVPYPYASDPCSLTGADIFAACDNGLGLPAADGGTPGGAGGSPGNSPTQGCNLPGEDCPQPINQGFCSIYVACNPGDITGANTAFFPLAPNQITYVVAQQCADASNTNPVCPAGGYIQEFNGAPAPGMAMQGSTFNPFGPLPNNPSQGLFGCVGIEHYQPRGGGYYGWQDLWRLGFGPMVVKAYLAKCSGSTRKH